MKVWSDLWNYIEKRKISNFSANDLEQMIWRNWVGANDLGKWFGANDLEQMIWSKWFGAKDLGQISEIN